jgi:hypothetical protein
VHVPLLHFPAGFAGKLRLRETTTTVSSAKIVFYGEGKERTSVQAPGAGARTYASRAALRHVAHFLAGPAKGPVTDKPISKDLMNVSSVL